MMRALGWLIGLIGALLLFMFGVIYLYMSNLANTDVPSWSYGIGVAGALLMGLWLFLDWGSLSNLRNDQTVARSATAGFATLLGLAIAIAANVVSHNYDQRWDFTETKRYTLSDQSVDIAKGLDREIEVAAFFPSGQPADTNFRDLIENYKRYTTLLKVEFHDPYKDPLLAQEMKIISGNGTVIVKVGENTQRLESKFDEEAFTNALIKVTSTEQHAVCFVTGHDEADSKDEQGEVGLGIAAVKLEGQNYKVSQIKLLDTPPTPTTCKVVVLASPRVDLLPVERDRLVQYVAAGGGLVVMLDPLLVPETAADMARFGVKVGNDAVIEADPARQIQGGDPTFVALDDASWDPSHPISSKLKGLAILRLARSVGKGDAINGLDVTILAHASDKSWGETTLTDTTVPAQPDEGKDIVGQVPLMAAVDVTDPAAMVTESAPSATTPGAIPTAAVASTDPLPRAAGGKVVVIGDSDFAGNQMILNGVNQDVLLNSVAWMVGESKQISIRANEAGKGKLSINVISGLLSGLGALVVAPGIAIAAAVGMWLRRRGL